MTALLMTISKYWPLFLLGLVALYLYAPQPKKEISKEEMLEKILKAKDDQISYLMEENLRLKEAKGRKEEVTASWEV